MYVNPRGVLHVKFMDAISKECVPWHCFTNAAKCIYGVVMSGFSPFSVVYRPSSIHLRRWFLLWMEMEPGLEV